MNRFDARRSADLQCKEVVEEGQENTAGNTHRLSYWLLYDPLTRDESLFKPERHDRASARDCSERVPEKEYIKTRREWEAYRREVVPRIQRFKAVIEKSLVQRVNIQQITLAFRRWKRFAQIESSMGLYQVLVVSHRAYYLRKALLRTCWRHLARAFFKWQQFTKRCAIVLLRLSLDYEWRLQRLALGKWYRALLAERLEEETAVSVWIRRQHQRNQVIQRKLRRSDRQLLISYWINWRVAIRKWKCMLSGRRQRFQNLRMFVQWTRFVACRKQEREIRRQPVRELVDELIESSVFQAQVNQAWVTKAQMIQIAVQMIERIVTAYQRHEAKQTCFRMWRAAAAVSSDSKVQVPAHQPQKEIRKVRLPERISALYRSQAHRGKIPGAKREIYRPHWR